MENILIVFGILILSTALGGTQLPKLPGAPLAVFAYILLFFNGIARAAMAKHLFIPVIIVAAVSVLIYLADKKVSEDSNNLSDKEKILTNSIFQGVFILLATVYFCALFFI
jgi:high-affinity Fe2+/Pb2+ permease